MKALIQTLLICAGFLLYASAAFSQQNFSPDTDEFQTTTSIADRQDRKTPSFFHRPKKATPTEQLAFAEKLENKERFGTARDEYNSLVHRWHNASEAPVAQFAMARVYFKQGKYERAFYAFQYLVDYYSGRFKYNEVLDYQFRIANHMITDRWGDILFFPGFEAPERALPLLNKIIQNAPSWNKAACVRLTIGMIYEDIKEYENAVTAYDALVQYHKDSEEAEEAMFRRATCLYTLSEKTPRDEKRCRTALSALATFMARYKKSEKFSEAESRLATLKIRLENMYYDRALFYDNNKKKPTAALIAYRDFVKKFPLSEYAQDTYARMEELELQIKE